MSSSASPLPPAGRPDPGSGPLPGEFTGQPPDFAAPRENPPAGWPGGWGPSPPEPGGDQSGRAIVPGPAPGPVAENPDAVPLVPAETAFRLRELGHSLLRTSAVPLSGGHGQGASGPALPPSGEATAREGRSAAGRPRISGPGGGQVSLAALAEQLSGRLSPLENPAEMPVSSEFPEARDLLDAPEPPVAPRPPAPSAEAGRMTGARPGADREAGSPPAAPVLPSGSGLSGAEGGATRLQPPPPSRPGARPGVVAGPAAIRTAAAADSGVRTAAGGFRPGAVPAGSPVSGGSALFSKPPPAVPSVPVKPSVPAPASRHGDVYFLGASPEDGEPREMAPVEMDVRRADPPEREVAPAVPPETAAGEPPALPDWVGSLQRPFAMESRGMAQMPARAEAEAGAGSPENRGMGLLALGAALAGLGILLACRLPLLGLNAARAAPGEWDRAVAEAGILLQGAAAITALALGLGAILQRRWAPPLISAAGWLAVFSATLLLGVAGVYLGSADHAALTLPQTGLLLAGLLMPLGALLYCENETVAEDCRAADPGPAWTDRHSVPGLMTAFCGAAVALTAAALLRHRPALPLPDGQVLTGTAAFAGWTGWGFLGLLAAVLAVRRHAAANWLLLTAALALSGTLAWCGWQGGSAWLDFLRALGHPASSLSAGSPLPAMLPHLAGLSPVLLFLVLAMARRAFSSSP